MSASSEGSASEAAQANLNIEWEHKPKDINANLKNYDAAFASFDWKDVEKCFDWSKTGKVNIVHEAIDRHAVSDKKDRIALIYTDYEGRDEQYTFDDLKRQSSRFADVLKKQGIKKGDRVGAFLSRTPELFIAILGIHRIGVFLYRYSKRLWNRRWRIDWVIANLSLA